MKISKTLKNLFYFNSKTQYNSLVFGKTSDNLINVSRNVAISRSNSMSATTSLINYLKSGKTVTAKQITARFGLANPHEAVRQLRMKGFAVYANNSTLWNGETTTRYRLGTPSRKMIAAAYAVLGGSAF
jgi:predicted transcriptional regulator